MLPNFDPMWTGPAIGLFIAVAAFVSFNLADRIYTRRHRRS